MSMNADTAVSVGITTDDIAAMKLARGVSFHYYDGKGHIRLYLERCNSDAIYTVREQKLFPVADRDRMRDIPVSTKMSGYGSGYDDEPGEREPGWQLEQYPQAAAFASITAPQFSPEWLTTVSCLRPGDELTLRWTADNNSATIRRAQLHTDSLYLDVRRKGKQSQPTMLRFHIAHSITPDNSARMIRKYGNG